MEEVCFIHWRVCKCRSGMVCNRKGEHRCAVRESRGQRLENMLVKHLRVSWNPRGRPHVGVLGMVTVACLTRTQETGTMTEFETSQGCTARYPIKKKQQTTLETPMRKFKWIKLEPRDKVGTENSPGRRVRTFVFKFLFFSLHLRSDPPALKASQWKLWMHKMKAEGGPARGLTQQAGLMPKPLGDTGKP